MRIVILEEMSRMETRTPPPAHVTDTGVPLFPPNASKLQIFVINSTHPVPRQNHPLVFKLFSPRLFLRTTRAFTIPKYRFRTMSTFDKLAYTPAEEAEISQWLITAERLKDTSNSGPALLDTVNK